MSNRRICAGVSAACGYPETTEVFVKELCRAGVGKIELFVNCEAETRPEYIREIKKILDGEGAKCISLHPYTCAIDTYALFSAYERRTEEYLDYHKRYFEAMNILGAEYFVFHGSKVNYGDEIVFGRFARLAEIAKSFGVKALQENVDKKVTGELETLKRMKAHFGSDASRGDNLVNRNEYGKVFRYVGGVVRREVGQPCNPCKRNIWFWQGA